VRPSQATAGQRYSFKPASSKPTLLASHIHQGEGADALKIAWRYKETVQKALEAEEKGAVHRFSTLYCYA
jgi:hypothetical protein